MHKIKYLILDIDGTLTDGKIYMGNAGESMKAFSIKDGYAFNYILSPAGIESIVITGRTSKIVENRCRELGITKVHQGITDKFAMLKDVIGIDALSTCAYFGDDIPDLECMKPIKAAGGVVGCPADATMEVKAVADYLCVNRAGEGALREFAEWLVNPVSCHEKIEQKVQSAIDYLEKLDMRQIGKGVHKVNEDFYYFVREYDTKKICDCVLESHRKYIDIQWMLDGEEAIDIADIAGLQMEQRHLEEKDCMTWKPIPNMVRAVMRAGSYMVLYPRTAHRGGIAVKEPMGIKKLVGKVRMY